MNISTEVWLFIGGYVISFVIGAFKINTMIAKLESQVENNSKRIDQLETQKQQTADDIKEVKESLHKIELAVERLSTIISMSNQRKDEN